MLEAKFESYPQPVRFQTRIVLIMVFCYKIYSAQKNFNPLCSVSNFLNNAVAWRVFHKNVVLENFLIFTRKYQYQSLLAQAFSYEIWEFFMNNYFVKPS